MSSLGSSLGRDFRWLWSGNAAGNLADGVALVGVMEFAADHAVISVVDATQTLGVGPTGNGVSPAASSLGGLLASFSTARMRQALGHGVLVPGALALGAITMLGLFLTTGPYVAGPIASTAGLAAPFGIAGLVLAGCAASTARLLGSEPHLAGRPAPTRQRIGDRP
jgi:hypothetical protein